MNRKFLVQSLTEFLREINEKVEYVVLFICQNETLLKVTSTAKDNLCCVFIMLRDLQELLKQHNDELDHLLVFL